MDTAIQTYFESRSGENYYARVAHNFKPINLGWIEDLLIVVQPRKNGKRLKILDFGSGTCRYLRYLYRHQREWFLLHGIERSSKAWQHIHNFERAGELPHGTVRNENWMNHSFSQESMDIVTSYMGLHYFPYIPNSLELGLGKALTEMSRCLKKDGIMHLLLRSGIIETYLPYYSRAHQADEIKTILKRLGLKPLRPEPKYEESPSLMGHEVPLGFKTTMSMFFYKV
ncbi:MAG: class I SAM-dependent methyltransferase [Alphaproteobacteria bacterium]|nr:class I SAM-dependent methyltransferase [Alphaproteobacteria bacterium]